MDNPSLAHAHLLFESFISKYVTYYYCGFSSTFVITINSIVIKLSLK